MASWRTWKCLIIHQAYLSIATTLWQALFWVTDLMVSDPGMIPVLRREQVIVKSDKFRWSECYGRK